MSTDWQDILRRIRQDRRSGASVLLGHGIEAARLFLAETQDLPRTRLDAALRAFTLQLLESQPSMAAFLRLANTLWLGREAAEARGSAWDRLHDALVGYAEGVDYGLRETVWRGSALVRSGALVVTYSHSTSVRLALWRAMAAGRRFSVVCSESRPMCEGVALARRLAAVGIPVRLTVDAALADWVGRADVVLLGADTVLAETVVNKVGTESLLRAARRARVAAYILADSGKWLPAGLAQFWRIREEESREVARLRDPGIAVENRYFGTSPLALVSGLVWEDGIARPAEVKRRIARLPVSRALIRLLQNEGSALTGGGATGSKASHRTSSGAGSINK